VHFYRTVRHNPPEPGYFLSGEVEGRPSPPKAHLVRFWQGFSAFDTLEQARRKAQQNPAQGAFIVELVIPDNAGIQWEKTFGPGHYTIWGDPTQCVRYSEHVSLVWESEGGNGNGRAV